jgi:phytoene dehydrogenase-like protein
VAHHAGDGMILVIGAGLAGLTCAKVLTESGQQVRVLEASDGIGGRVRTDHHPEGFLLDRGFQVLLTAYPAVQRHLDLAALGPREIAPGAVMVRDGKWHPLGDPFKRLALLGPTLANPLLPFGDKLRVGALRRRARRRSVSSIFLGKGQDRSSHEELRRAGFSESGFIANFARPFFGGVFLDRELETSGRMLLFTVKMLAEGRIVVPEAGVGAIAEQIANRLPEGAVRLRTPVEELVQADGRAVGVSLPGGEEMQGDVVVLATEAPAAARLAGLQIPDEPRRAVAMYFASDRSLYDGPRLLLNANPDAFVNTAVQISNVAPGYAPAGQHLLSVSVLGDPQMDDAALVERCRAELAPWFPRHDLGRLRHLATYRIPFAQFKQLPGIFATLPPNVTPTPGLFLAGEYAESSSIHGAMHSGEKAAQAVLDYLRSEA